MQLFPLAEGWAGFASPYGAASSAVGLPAGDRDRQGNREGMMGVQTKKRRKK